MSITWATLRTRWASFLGTFAALTLGVTIVTAALLVEVSAEPSVPERYTAAGVLVHGPPSTTPESSGWIAPVPWSDARTTELSGKLAALDGVSQVIPDRSFFAQALIDGAPVGDVRADPQGHGWSSTLLGDRELTDGTAPAGPGEVVAPEDLGVGVGEELTLLTAAGPVTYRVTGTLDGPGFHVTDEAAAELADGVTVLGVLTAPGADASVDEAATALLAGDGVVLHGDERITLEPESHSRTRWLGTQLLTSMTTLSAFAAVFVVASTFAFGVAQRRRELGLMRTIGATPGQIRRMLFGEALGVGVLASAAGIVLGLVLAPILGNLLVDAELEPPDFAIRVAAWPLLVSGLVGMLVAFLGVWAASRRAAKVRPMEALREASVDARPMTRGRWILGGMALLGGVACAVGAAGADADSLLSLSMFAAIGLIVGLTLYSPVIIPPVVRLAALPFTRAKGATWTVVRESALVAVRRVASTAAPVLVTVGFVVLLAGMVQTMKGATETDLAAELPTPVLVQPEGTPGLSNAVVEALPGEAQAVMTVDVYLGREQFTVSGLSDADVPAGTIRIAAPYMETLGLAEGDELTLTFPDGEAVPLKVQAGEVDGQMMYPSAAIVARETLRVHAPNALTDTVFLTGTTVAEAAPAVEGLGGVALDREGFAAHTDQREWELLRVFMLVLLIMAIGYTALAIANTLVMANADRLKDFAVLRLSGAGKGQVLKVVAVETVLVVAVGTGLGLVVAIAALEGVRRGLESDIGADVAMVIPWNYAGMVIAAALALALGASLLTARAALRVPAVRLAGMKE